LAVTDLVSGFTTICITLGRESPESGELLGALAPPLVPGAAPLPDVEEGGPFRRPGFFLGESQSFRDLRKT